MKKKILVLVAAGVMLNYSCQKSLLSPQSQTQVSDQDGQPFSNASRIQSQVLSLYTAMRNGQLYGGRYQVYNDVKAENWINASGNQITASNTWSEAVTTTSDEVKNLWAQAYYAINLCNLFIDGMASKGTAVVGTTLATQYIAEAKFVRATCYYALLQMYARPYADGAGSKPGVPLRLTGLSSYAEQSQAKATTGEVYAQIIKDLDDAEAGLPTTYGVAATNITRAHKNTAIAFKTRVYLQMQKFSNVITEANKIVTTNAPFTSTSGVTFALQSDVTNVFKSPYTTSESIFSFPWVSGTEQVGTQNALSYYFYNNGSAGSAEFYLNTAGVISDPNWKDADKRKSFIYTNTTSGRKYISKWSLGTPYLDWTPVMRYAEVLLNLAEARVKSTNSVDAQAVALLNAIRNRSDNTTTYTPASFANADALFAAIMQERNIEFLGEGLRNTDLMRYLSTIPGKSNVTAIPATDTRYIWPISGDELLYNSKIGGSNN